MFIKNTSIRCLIVDTVDLAKEELDALNKHFLKEQMIFYIPIGEGKPPFLDEKYLLFREPSGFFLNQYRNIVQELTNLTGRSSDEMVIISKKHSFLKNFIHLPIGTILINNAVIQYKDIGYLPDRKLKNFDELESLKFNDGVFGEVLATSSSQPNIPFGKRGNLFVFQTNKEVTPYTVLALGRFFKYTHELHPVHQLSQRIVRNKNRPDQYNLFSNLFTRITSLIIRPEENQVIMNVPSRPSEEDRLFPIVESISKKTGLRNFSKEIKCIEDYPKQKGLNKIQRKENVKGKFFVSDAVSGKSIILIDDVFTTGATLDECVNQLMLKGATSVICIVLGINQWDTPFGRLVPKCKVCGEDMVMRINRKTNIAFFACTQGSGENHTANFIDTWQETVEGTAIQPSTDENQEWEF